MEVAERLAGRVGDALKARGFLLAVAESCTGGWVAKVITGVPGSSTWFDRGFVPYSDGAKQDMLGVRAETLQRHGAVSEETVREMVLGALAFSRAQMSIAVSGIAGPDGGSPAKPVGTVWIAWTLEGRDVMTRVSHFAGDRAMIRQQAVMAALRGALDMMANVPGTTPTDGSRAGAGR